MYRMDIFTQRKRDDVYACKHRDFSTMFTENFFYVNIVRLRRLRRKHRKRNDVYACKHRDIFTMFTQICREVLQCVGRSLAEGAHPTPPVIMSSRMRTVRVDEKLETSRGPARPHGATPQKSFRKGLGTKPCCTFAFGLLSCCFSSILCGGHNVFFVIYGIPLGVGVEIPALTEQKIFVLSQQAGWAVTFQISLFFGMRKPLLRATFRHA
jgi:hypothetical protein